MSELERYQRQQARLAAALVRYQGNPWRGLNGCGLAFALERSGEMVQAVLYHKDGGQIESGYFPAHEFAQAKDYVLGVAQ